MLSIFPSWVAGKPASCCRYSYYLVSGAKLFRIPVVFKKSITVLQMVQFAALLSQVRPLTPCHMHALHAENKA